MKDTPQQSQQREDTASPTHGSLHSHELPDLTRMMQAILEDGRLCEAEIAEDRQRRKRESAERMKGMHENIEMLQRLVTDRGTATTHRSHSEHEELRLACLTKQDDIEVYLRTFERTIEAYGNPQVRWSFKLT